MREQKGNFYTLGKESPYRDRSVDESLDLFARMRTGEFADGAHVLRAKIDMQSPNMNLRDPVIYRIRRAHHHRTGDDWCIYPMYDFAHGLSDAIEHITHSICTLEFENHRPLYDWFLDQLETPSRPQQIEFARLNLNFTVMSKRKLLTLVQEGRVGGWDDPRMPTLAGMRRRGYPPEAIRQFIDRTGVAKRDGVVDIAQLEFAVREHLNETTPRVMAVLRPLKVVITNYPEDQVDEFDAPYHPDRPEMGSRKVPFSRVLFIEQDDFREDPPRKWFRLAPGREIRLRYACLITCQEAIKDDEGRVIELRCTWDPASRGGDAPDGRRVKGTSHWVSADHAVTAEVRLYDRLFNHPRPGADADFHEHLNPDSLEVLTNAHLEPSTASVESGACYQFERLGYFCVDPDSKDERAVYNRTATLRDTWARVERSLEREQAHTAKAERKKRSAAKKN